jgi:hypothetical protein
VDLNGKEDDMLKKLKNNLDRQRPLIVGLGLLLLLGFGMGSSLWAEEPSQSLTAGARDCQVKRGLIILVEFPDVKHSIDKRYGQKRFFQELNRYVQAMSYQKVCLGGEVTTKWYEMPKSINEYRISPRNLEVDKSRVTQLIQDAIDTVDKDVDLSRYDFNVLFLGARRDQYGMIGLCGYPGMLGWSSDFSMKTKSGQVLKGGAAIYCYQAHLGTLFHDIAHILGGLKEGRRMVPCLYDHDLQAKPGPLRETFAESVINMGFWDPMSCHYYRWELPPPGISSWTKMRLGWLDPQKIKLIKPGETAEFLLGPLEDGASQILAVKIPLSEKRYYLIENRQPIGFDRHLPGNGVLIMIVDDTVAECRQGWSPVKLINADPSIPQLEGAAFDIGKKDSYVDQSNNLKIQLLEKAGSSYKIRISPK